MSNAPPAKKHKDPVSKLLGDLFENEQPSSHSHKFSNKVKIYKAVKPAELDSDAQVWWNTQKLVYPLMSQLVKKVSVCCKQCGFRVPIQLTGDVITEQHNCLTSEHANQLIFLLRIILRS